jgi:hypothetical protein
LASKNKTTVLIRTQATITQQELVELAVVQQQLAQWTATCQHRQGRITAKLGANAVIEPGRFFLEGTSMEVRS